MASNFGVARRDCVRQAIATLEANALLVTSAVNVRYLTGFTGSNGAVWVGSDESDDRLLTDARYDERARREADGIELSLTADPLAPLPDGATVAADFSLAVEAQHMPWALALRLEQRLSKLGARLIAIENLIEEHRTIKNASEIAAIASACKLTTEAMRWLFERVGPGRTERELTVALERRFMDLGAEAVAFPSIVATGRNGAIPHHRPDDTLLVAGDLLTVDCGAVVDGYYADCTRTVAIASPATRWEEIHGIVATAQAAGMQAATVGASAASVDTAARSTIAEHGYGDAFLHGTGHGVGLEIHEGPAVTAGANATLGAGMVITVEPGIYLPGTGGVRIEDTLVVSDQGPTCLTDLERALIVV